MHSNPTEGEHCRCSDPHAACWPTSEEWNAFNVTISGRLITPEPTGTPTKQFSNSLRTRVVMVQFHCMQLSLDSDTLFLAIQGALAMIHILMRQSAKLFGITEEMLTCEQATLEACNTRIGRKTESKPVRWTRLGGVDVIKGECQCGGYEWKP
jgi:hypothetical protein